MNWRVTQVDAESAERVAASGEAVNARGKSLA